MASSISYSDHRLPMSKRRLKPLSLRDYLLDDLSSCSSNGFKSLPRRQSSTVRRLLDAEIKRSGGIYHHKRRPTCGVAFGHAVQKASTALLSAVKLLPFPSSSVKSLSPSRKKGIFSRSFSRNLWKKVSHRELNNVNDGEIERKTEDREQKKIQRGRSFGDFLQESLDQPSDRICCISPPTESTFSGEATLPNAAGGDSASFGSELFTKSAVTQSSSSGESETSNENDVVGDVTEETTNGVAVMMSGDCVGSRVSDGSSVNDNREECMNEENEQLSPISILQCPFQDDAITPLSHQKETDEKKLLTKSRRFESWVRLEPVDLEKRIEQYVERKDYDSHHMVETEEDQPENRANRLFALVKSRLIDEPSHLLASKKVDNLLLDLFKEDGRTETRDEDKLKIVEEWLMRRQEEEYMCISWEVREKREIYVKEMKWGCINGDEKEYVVEELGNGFITSLINELILDLSLQE